MFKLLLILALLPLPAFSEAPVVSDAVISSDGWLYNFTVTVDHVDEGWDHYVDRWVIKSVDGDLLATRNLNMPHITDSGHITRSYGGLELSKNIDHVVIQAHDTLYGWGSEIVVPLRDTTSAPPRP